MTDRPTVRIAGTGMSVPDRVLSNQDLEKLVETSNDWIVKRTGILERRVIETGQATSDLATEAARVALERAEMDPSEVDCIIVATITPDNIFPSTACHVQRKLGADRASAFDLSAACTGFLYAFDVGWRMIASGGYQNILVIGAEALSTITNYQDRTTCILFGDGAGAVVLRPAREGETGEVVATNLEAEGDHEELMVVPAGGSAIPASHDSVEKRLHYMELEGRKVFKFAVSTYRKLVLDILMENNIPLEDLTLLIPHQVNLRIIEAAQKKLDIPNDRVYVNIEKYGNTSAASIPIALAQADAEGRLRSGDVLVMIAFGAGLTWGSALVKW